MMDPFQRPRIVSSMSGARRRSWAATPVFVIALVLGGCGRDADQAREADPDVSLRTLGEASLGPVRAKIQIADGELRFGQRFPLTLEIAFDQGTELLEDSSPARLGHLRVRKDLGTDKSAGLVRARYLVEAERVGQNFVAIPPLRFKVKEGEGAGTTRALEFGVLAVEIAKTPEGEIPSLASLAAPLSPLEVPSRGRSRWLGVVLALLGALLSGIVVLWRRMRRGGVAKAPPPIDPAEEARRELDRLLSRGLVAEKRFGEFFLHLTGIVRRFIERTTGISAPKQTTEEFLRAMEQQASFPEDRKRHLGDFLMAADLVKFAAMVPAISEVDGAVASARSFCGLEAPASGGGRA